MRSSHALTLSLAAVSLSLAASTTAAAGLLLCQAHCTTAIALPAGSRPFGITRGPLGSIWFSFSADPTVARIDPHGQLTAYRAPGPGGLGWVLADRGGVWFTELDADKIGRITPTGTITEYPLPTMAAANGLVRGPDHNLYFTEQDGNAIGRLNPRNGATEEFAIPTPASEPLGLTVGADGALWFVERTAGKVGRMTLDGAFTEYPLAPGAVPNRIVTGPDGAVWFTELRANKLGRLTVDGQLSEYPIPGGPVGITVGNDRQLYLALFTGGGVDRVDLHGIITGHWDLPGAVGVLQIAPGFGHDLWITDTFGDQLYHLTPYATRD
jgi:virginiamycin B lyase